MRAWDIYKRLLRYAKPYVGMYAIGVCGMILFAATDASLAYLVKLFINGAFISKHPDILWMVPGGVIVLFTLRGIGDYVSNYFPGWVGRQVIKGLRRDVFSHYLRLPTAYLDTQQSGHLLSKLTYNIELVADAATNASISLIRDSVTIIFLIAYLFYLNWRLAVFCLAADHQPQLPALQRTYSELDGGYHAGCEGGDRCTPPDQDLQRRGTPDAAFRAG